MNEYKIEPILSPILISSDSPETDYQSNYHIHTDSYEFYLFINGDVTFFIGEKRYHLDPFDYFVILPNTIHKASIHNHTSYQRFILHIKETTLLELSTPQTNFHHSFTGFAGNVYHFSQEEQPAILAIKEQLLPTFNQKKLFGYDVLQQSYLSVLLVKSILNAQNTEHISCAALSPLLVNVTDYINLYYQENINIDMIAKQFSVSRSSLCHQFRTNYNTSLWNYVVSKRLVLAQKLLLEGASLSDACYTSGFSDYSHFVKTFSRKFGVSPKQYGKSMQNKTTIILS